MTRRLLFAAACTAALLAAFGAPAPQAAQAPATSGTAPAGPIKLVRHPDYHAGKIAFSYLGDIWMANEDGSGPNGLTINTARETSTRASRPTAGGSRSSSNRFGNNDVFVVPAAGGAAAAAHVFLRRRRTWSAGRATDAGALPERARRRRLSERGDAAPGAGRRRSRDGRCRWTGVTTAASRPTAGRSCSTAIRRSWSRKHFRGSYAADIWIADLAQKNYRQLLADERYNRFWPMWGADGNIYFVGDPLPNEQHRQAGHA